MSFKYILLDKKDGIATITFHRPEALNALNSEVLADLDAVVDDVIADDEVRVVVFTGEGKSFIDGRRHGAGGNSLFQKGICRIP